MSKDKEETREQNKQWLLEQVNHVLEPIIADILHEKPKDMVDYMIQQLEAKYGERARNGDVSEIARLQSKIQVLQAKVEKQRENKQLSEQDSAAGSEDETDSDEEDDYVDNLAETIAKQKNKGPRVSVSAEAFGKYNKKADFKLIVIPKSEESKKAIYEKLNKSFMFEMLSEGEKTIVVNAMEEVQMEQNQWAIKEGDQGDCLYVVGSGSLDCTKIFPGNTEPTYLLTYQPGMAFGELALLYNAPRAASIQAKENCTLWKLDRGTFNHIVKDAAIRKRDKYEEFLEKVEILSTLDTYERSQLTDAFSEHSFKAGDYIIRENEEGNDLFMLQEGRCIATKILEQGKPAEKVMDYAVGSYFGERALIKNEPRAANVIAETDCTLVSMNRHAVKRLLGPLDHLLRRNMDMYEKFTIKK